MGMFDRPTPKIDLQTPYHIQKQQELMGLAGETADKYVAPLLKEKFGYESQERQLRSMAAQTDLSDGQAVQETYNTILAKNPAAAKAWIDSVMPTLKANIEQQKLAAVKPKAPAVFQQKINQIKAMNIPAGEKADMIKKVLSGAQTQISIDQTTESAYGKAIAKEQAPKDIALIEGAKQAKRSIEKTNEVLSLLGQGDPQVGFGAEFLTDINRVLGKLGVSPEAAKSASDTQLLNALLGSDVFPMIKSLGIGARGLDTPAEREFLREVMTGTVKLEGDTLERMTKLRQKYMSSAINEYNDRLGKGELDRYKKATGIGLSPMEIPKMYTPRPTNALELINKATGEKVYKYPDGNIYTQDGKLFKKGAK
jgi:hypothetical protein